MIFGVTCLWGIGPQNLWGGSVTWALHWWKTCVQNDWILWICWMLCLSSVFGCNLSLQQKNRYDFPKTNKHSTWKKGWLGKAYPFILGQTAYFQVPCYRRVRYLWYPHPSHRGWVVRSSTGPMLRCKWRWRRVAAIGRRGTLLVGWFNQKFRR